MMASADEDEELEIINISLAGDLLLEAKGDDGLIKASYRVSSKQLIKNSEYYKKLFSSDFNDGREYRKQKAKLEAKYSSNGLKIPISDLAKVSVPFPIGCRRDKIVLKAIKLFLQAAHEDGTKSAYPESGDWLLINASSDIDTFAHAVALADQLGASLILQRVAEEILKVQPMCTKKPRTGNLTSERYWRQCLYIAYTYKQPVAFTWISGGMIWHGLDTSDTWDAEAPWMNLPNNIEDEIAIRREGIFNTIASIPNALLKPYMLADKSKSPICKLGWSHSPACDSFQLGESIRWLCRRKLAAPSIVMAFAVPTNDLQPPNNTPRAMIKLLREFPEYQLDEHHSRCGIKGKLVQILDVVEKLLLRSQQVGICLECCRSSVSDRYSWSHVEQSNTIPYKGNLAKDIQNMRISSDSGVVKHTASKHAKCALQLEHELYSKVFSPERWTEKEWLIGDAQVL